MSWPVEGSRVSAGGYLDRCHARKQSGSATIARDVPPSPTRSRETTPRVVSAASTPALRERLFSLVPAAGALRSYRAADARADLVAGLSVAAVAVPQAIAYALVAGIPPQYGLYTAIVMTAVGAIFDSSRQLINGPTNAISIAVFSVIAAIEVPEQRLAAAILLAFLVGSIQLGIVFLRLGDLTRYISHSVIVGFTLGAGSLLVFDQLKNLIGLPALGGAEDHFVVRFVRTLTAGNVPHAATCAIGFGTIALVLGMRWLKRQLGAPLFPELLVAVAGMAALVGVLGLDQQDVKVIGEVPAQLPRLAAPSFDLQMIRDLGSGALAIALLGLLEAISMAKAIAARTGQRLDMNQQCLSEALANLAGSFFQCFPGSGSLTRSAINQQAGAVSQWSGVVSAFAVAGTVLLLADYARFIPRAALAGVLIVASYNLIDWRALRYHLRATRFDAAIVGVTALAAIAISIEFCVLVGVLMSFMLTVPRAGRMLLTQFVIDKDGGVHERLPEDFYVCKRIVIFGLEGEMFFGATAALEQHFAQIESAMAPETRILVLRLKRARSPDAVGMTLLEGFLERMRERGVRVILCGVRADFFEMIRRTGIDARHGEQIFLEQPVRQTSTLLAIRHAYQILEEPCSICPRRDVASLEGALYYAI
jgi:sulfate permease, SulP family